MRGDKKYYDRSLKILDQIVNDKTNEPYLFNTEGKSIEEVADEIIKSDRYFFS
jgi:hypothetical protein